MNQFFLLRAFKFMRQPIGLLLADSNGISWLKERLVQTLLKTNNDPITVGNGLPFDSDGFRLNILLTDGDKANKILISSENYLTWIINSNYLSDIVNMLDGMISNSLSSHIYVDLNEGIIRQIVISNESYSEKYFNAIKHDQIFPKDNKFPFAHQ